MILGAEKASGDKVATQPFNMGLEQALRRLDSQATNRGQALGLARDPGILKILLGFSRSVHTETRNYYYH